VEAGIVGAVSFRKTGRNRATMPASMEVPREGETRRKKSERAGKNAAPRSLFRFPPLSLIYWST